MYVAVDSTANCKLFSITVVGPKSVFVTFVYSPEINAPLISPANITLATLLYVGSISLNFKASSKTSGSILL